MSERIHALAHQYLGKNILEDCTISEVESLAQRYPYSAPVQFLLLQKMKQEGHPGYEAQYQKSVLYYHDPILFEYFIYPEKFYTQVQPANNETSENYKSEITEPKVVELPQMDQTIKPETFATSSELIEKTVTEPEVQLNKSDDLLFEPYHTVDYFASQGIKPLLDEAPKDAFGKQLKSFTEWLKTMKRLPAAELPKNIDANTEKKVVHMATDSVHDPHVATEAMAEVWLKQGNTEKAIEIYNKLSLINPSKKAFFAAKIDNLKHS